MKPPQQLIKTITQWAKTREDIRALILIGSYAKRGKADRLSKELAQTTNIRYPQVLQEHLTALIDQMRSNPK